MAESKLTNDQRMLVLRMHGEGFDSGYIKRELKAQFDISLAHSSIRKTCEAKKHQPFVKNFRDTYLSKVRSVPIANKRIRLDDLERERKRLNRLIEGTPTKTKSDKMLYLSFVGELRRLSEVAREEMEKKPHLFQNVVVGMGDMSDDELYARKQKIIDKLRRGGAFRAPAVAGGADEED